MFIASHNKNPLINFERKSLKQQKSQKSLGSKFPNMLDKNAWNLKINEKGRVIWYFWPWERKTLQKDRRKTTKKLVRCLDRLNRERKSFEKFEKCLNTWKRKVFKKLSKQLSIDRKLGSIDWKCFDWSNINRASIETDRGWPKF